MKFEVPQIPTLDLTKIQQTLLVSDELLALENEPDLEFASSPEDGDVIFLRTLEGEAHDLFYITKAVYDYQIRFVLQVNILRSVFGAVGETVQEVLTVARDLRADPTIDALLDTMRASPQEFMENFIEGISSGRIAPVATFTTKEEIDADDVAREERSLAYEQVKQRHQESLRIRRENL